MRLIGMMDSPYVRRVAVSLRLLGLDYTHDQLSVFRDYAAFAAINPVVKAPTLVTDDGVTLVDSTLILDYLDRLVPADRRLTPTDPAAFVRGQRVIGLALVIAEKSVQTLYELKLRPDGTRHQPWLDRVGDQLREALRLLDAELGDGASWLFGASPLQADITAAVAWRFVHEMLPDLAPADRYPALARLSARAEATPAFLACPFA